MPRRRDLFHRELGGIFHRHAYRVAQRPGQSDPDWTGENLQAARSSEAARGIASRAPAMAALMELQATRRSTHLPIWTGLGPARISTMLDGTDRSPDATFDLHGRALSRQWPTPSAFCESRPRRRPGGIVRLIHPVGTGRRWSAHPHPVRACFGAKESGRWSGYGAGGDRRQLSGPAGGLSRTGLVEGEATPSPSVRARGRPPDYRATFSPRPVSRSAGSCGPAAPTAAPLAALDPSPARP